MALLSDQYLGACNSMDEKVRAAARESIANDQFNAAVELERRRLYRKAGAHFMVPSLARRIVLNIQRTLALR